MHFPTILLTFPLLWPRLHPPPQLTQWDPNLDLCYNGKYHKGDLWFWHRPWVSHQYQCFSWWLSLKWMMFCFFPESVLRFCFNIISLMLSRLYSIREDYLNVSNVDLYYTSNSQVYVGLFLLFFKKKKSLLILWKIFRSERLKTIQFWQKVWCLLFTFLFYCIYLKRFVIGKLLAKFWPFQPSVRYQGFLSSTYSVNMRIRYFC